MRQRPWTDPWKIPTLNFCRMSPLRNYQRNKKRTNVINSKLFFHNSKCLSSLFLNLALSDQISRSVMSDSLQPHDPQHARPPCPSPTPGVHLNLCPLSLWCHPANSSSVVPFSSCPQSFPASGSFPMSQLFALGGQSIGVSASMLIFVNDSFEFAIT